jgi:hypothetical protein
MQFLSKERREELAPIMKVWKEHREALAIMDVLPIGEKPSGRSITGFLVTQGENARYLLLFREVTDRTSTVIPLGVKKASCEILASNTNAKVEILDGAVFAELADERSYVFVKIN